MTDLRQQLRGVADAYADKVAEIIGYQKEDWAAENISVSVCSFGDIYYFGLDDMQVIVDHLEAWTKKYGSVENVGKTVIGWYDWYLDTSYQDKWNIRPRINLYSWLLGARPDTLKKDIMLDLERQLDTLREVAEEYPTSTITNAAKQIEARLKVLREKRDKEMKAWLEKSEAYKEFTNTINELKTEQ